MLILVGLLAFAPGQVAKFDGRKPDAAHDTVAKMEDVERCLIRAVSPPQVYRQPDKPDEVTIVWIAGGLSSGEASGRVDLRRNDNGGTSVRGWFPEKLLMPCAPKA